LFTRNITRTNKSNNITLKLKTNLELHIHGIYNYLKTPSKRHLHDTLRIPIFQKNRKEREEEIRPCPLSHLTLIQESYTSITFTHELNTLPLASTPFLKTHSPPSHMKETKTITISTRRKWNEYKMGKWHRRGENYRNIKVEKCK
jgi:hypothetical protein